MTGLSWKALRSSRIDVPLQDYQRLEKKDIHTSESVGIPGHKPRTSWQDWTTQITCLVCGAVALLSMWKQDAAAYLGQTNQLIVLGFLLSIMSYCTQRLVLSLALLSEERHGMSKLQNFDALLRNSVVGSRIGTWIRILLVLLFALPLGLSAAYKNYVGGSSSISIPSTSGFFGYVYRPEYQRLGVIGIALMVDAYLPFWLDPVVNRTCGFNLFAESNRTAAMLDAPWPSYLTELQSSLRAGDSLLLSSIVNATTADQIDILPEQRANSTWWGDWQSTFKANVTKQGGPYGRWFSYLAGCDLCKNWTTQFFSSWNTEKNQTFQSEALRIQLSRRLYQGTWNVTSTNILLISATALQHSPPVLQNVIQNNRFGLQEYYPPIVMEFNWAWRNSLSSWVPPSSRLLSQTLGYFPRVNLVPALAAVITWSRMVSEDGAERFMTQDRLSPSALSNDSFGYGAAYWKDASEISTVRSVVTLQRCWLLAAIIAVHPILTVLSLVGKALLYSTPIGEGFGTISLMAGIERGTLDVLRGAALTGELSRDIKVRFITKPSSGEDVLGTSDRLSIQLDGSKLSSARRTDRLEPKKLYR